MSDAKSKRIPVSINANTYVSLKSYSELTRVPMTEVLADAVSDWLETVGAARLETINSTKSAMKKVLTFPAIQSEPDGFVDSTIALVDRLLAPSADVYPFKG